MHKHHNQYFSVFMIKLLLQTEECMEGRNELQEPRDPSLPIYIVEMSAKGQAMWIVNMERNEEIRIRHLMFKESNTLCLSLRLHRLYTDSMWRDGDIELINVAKWSVRFQPFTFNSTVITLIVICFRLDIFLSFLICIWSKLGESLYLSNRIFTFFSTIWNTKKHKNTPFCTRR